MMSLPKEESVNEAKNVIKDVMEKNIKTAKA